MRPRKREEEEEDDEEAPSPDPPPRAFGGLSSMVVRPPESGGGGDAETGDAAAAAAATGGRHESPPPSRRRYSPPAPRRRGFPPDPRRRDSLTAVRRSVSPPYDRRRGGSASFRPRYQRFHHGPELIHRHATYASSASFSGGECNAGSISPPRRQRLDDVHFDPEYDPSVGQRYSGGFRGGRGSEGFRDVSPRYGSGRGGRSVGRGYNVSGRGLIPFEGEYVHRNDPNLSPREGDWICRNPSCGNLNFARRTHCNKCNRYRYGTEFHGPSLSPRRGYLHSPVRRSPPRITGPVIDHGLLRDVDSYRSPRGWDAHDPRDFRPGSPPLGVGGRPVDHVRRGRVDFCDELQHRGRSKFGWPVSQWDSKDVGRDGFVPDRSYNRHVPSPRGGWIGRERSRSPIGHRTMKGSYVSRGQDDRRYDSYLDHREGDGLGRGHGRGYQRGNSSTGRGRGNRRGMTHGQSGDMY